MANEGNTNITCYDCGADVPVTEIESGRCPKCGYDIQGHKDYMRRQGVLERDAKKKAEEDRKKTPPKRRGLF